ncbi:MAG: hypothetical protein V4719_13290 [Planctomycetota bacterium]
MRYFNLATVIGCIATIAFLLLQGCALLNYYIVESRHRALYHRLEVCLDRLETIKPVEINHRQWEFIILWTRNALGNCCASSGFIQDEARFANMADELERRLNERPGLSTVEWIWDEFEAVSQYGRRYSAQWCPTHSDRLAEVGEGTKGGEE